MLYNVKGKLTVSDVNFIVVECGGVGFKCFTTLNTVKNMRLMFLHILQFVRTQWICTALPHLMS